MPGRLALPSIATVSTEGIPFGVTMFLNAVHDSLKTLDSNVIYRDVVSVAPAVPRIRRMAAQGQAFTVSSVNLASGEDHAVLVNDCKTLLQSHIDLTSTVNTLIDQLRGT
jgi:hypothetical protein